MIVSIWDDGYGISVPTHNQRAKADIAEMLSGFQRKEGENQGCEIIQVKAWDYPSLLDAFARAEHFARTESVPVVVHVIEVTQPQGLSLIHIYMCLRNMSFPGRNGYTLRSMNTLDPRK